MHGDAGGHGDRRRRSATTASPSRAGCSWRSWGSGSTATTSPPPRWRAAPSRCSAPARRRPRRSSSPTSWSRWHAWPGTWSDRVRPTVLALTGSQGKTGTKDYLGQVLAGVGPTVATAGNLNNELGVPLTVLRCTAETEYLVVEMGARGIGHIAELCRIAPPDVAAVLNVGTAHLGEFGSREAIAPGEGRAGRGARPRGHGRAQRRRRPGRGHAPPDPGPGAHLRRAGRRERGATSSSTTSVDRRSPWLTTASGTTSRSASPARHQVANATAAAAMALAVGVDLAHVARALTAATPTSRWRMELHERADGLVVVNDAYNANPASMAAALDALVAIGGRRGARTVAVLGEMLELGAATADDHERRRPVRRRARRRRGRHRRRRGRGHRARRRRRAGLARAWRSTRRAVTRHSTWVRENAAAGDVLLVKASRGAALETVAEGLLRRRRRGGREPMRSVLFGGGFALLISLLGTRVAITWFTRLGLGPGDPRRRPDQPPHQARHAHDGRAGHHLLGRRGLLRGQDHHPERAVGLGAAPPLPLRGAGRRRLPRRLHQDQAAAEPRAAQPRQDDRPDRGGAGLRRPRRSGTSSPTTGATPRRPRTSPSCATSSGWPCRPWWRSCSSG